MRPFMLHDICVFSGGLNMPNITRVFDDDLMTVRHIWGMEFSSYLLQEVGSSAMG